MIGSSLYPPCFSPKGSRKNDFTFLHPTFRYSGAMPEMRTVRRHGRAPATLSMLFALTLCGALCHATTARAVDAQQVRQLLRVRPGATCLSSERLAREVEQWLYDEEIATDVTIVVEGSAKDPRSAVLRVVRAGRTLAHRAFEPGPAGCDRLQAAVGLAIALALKASMVDELAQPLGDDPVARAYGWSLSAASIGTYQVLPGFAPGLGLAAHWALGPRVAFRFGAVGVRAFDAELERSGGRFDATLIAGRCDACVRAMLTTGLRAQACAGVLGGGLSASGNDFANARTSVVAWFAFANAAGLELELSTHWSLTLDFSVAFPFHGVRIGIEDSDGTEVDGQSLDRAGFALEIGPMYNF